MKQLLFIIFLLPNVIFAQDLLTKFEKLKEEIEYIETQKLKINSISISPSGDWVVLYGDFGYSYSYLPKNAISHLEKSNKEGNKIKDFDFISDTAWVCISQHNAFALKYAPQSLVDELKKLNSQKHEIFQIAYINGSWSIIYNKGEIFNYKINSETTKSYENIKKSGRIIKNIAYNSSGGYIALYGKNDYSTKNIAPEAESTLKQLKEKDSEINMVIFYNMAWLIIYDNNKYACNF